MVTAAPPALSVQDVAARLSVSPAAVRDWIKSGLLPARRVGKLFRVDLREFECWLDAQRTEVR